MTDTSPITSRPVVSIVVDGYNETRFLGTAIETLEALEKQDFPLNQAELILIGTSEQVEHWKQTFPAKSRFFARHFVKLDGAHYFQLKNRGAEAATADIIVFTDSDVYPKPTWLSSLVQSIRDGADVVAGLSLFKNSGSWLSDSPTRLAAASITWGWVVSKDNRKNMRRLQAAGFMDHNIAFRAETFRSHKYREENGRLMAGPLLYRALKESGATIALQPKQQVVHFFSWEFWLIRLHFRYGYEVFQLRRLDKHYPNQWISRTRILEPLVTMVWHVLLDIPRWFRVSRLLGIGHIRRIAILPLVVALSVVARCSEMAGMYASMMVPTAMKRWAEAV
jgi:glycosyltransferase involved in cell wall biosynthesis